LRKLAVSEIFHFVHAAVASVRVGSRFPTGRRRHKSKGGGS
jgi:hypothetical protein